MVSAESEPFKVAKLDGQKERNRTTAIQRVLVPCLISKYGMSCKKVKFEVLRQMVAAVIDKDDLLDLGAPCEDMTKTYSLKFNGTVKRAKLAAGMFTFIHKLCIMMVML